jgi:hypothetical protein
MPGIEIIYRPLDEKKTLDNKVVSL